MRLRRHAKLADADGNRRRLSRIAGVAPAILHDEEDGWQRKHLAHLATSEFDKNPSLNRIRRPNRPATMYHLVSTEISAAVASDDFFLPLAELRPAGSEALSTIISRSQSI